VTWFSLVWMWDSTHVSQLIDCQPLLRRRHSMIRGSIWMLGTCPTGPVRPLEVIFTIRADVCLCYDCAMDLYSIRSGLINVFLHVLLFLPPSLVWEFITTLCILVSGIKRFSLFPRPYSGPILWIIRTFLYRFHSAVSFVRCLPPLRSRLSMFPLEGGASSSKFS